MCCLYNSGCGCRQSDRSNIDVIVILRTSARWLARMRKCAAPRSLGKTFLSQCNCRQDFGAARTAASTWRTVAVMYYVPAMSCNERYRLDCALSLVYFVFGAACTVSAVLHDGRHGVQAPSRIESLLYFPPRQGLPRRQGENRNQVALIFIPCLTVLQ